MMKKIALISIIAAFPQIVSAGLDDWIRKEVIPTVTGERPLEIKPYVEVNHDGNQVLYVNPGEDTAKLQVGGVTVQTHQLTKRAEQAGCLVATEGSPACVADVVEREQKNLANQVSTGVINALSTQIAPPMGNGMMPPMGNGMMPPMGAMPPVGVRFN